MQIGGPQAYNERTHAFLTSVDTTAKVYPIQGSYISYRCIRIKDSEKGKNCVTVTQPTASGFLLADHIWHLGLRHVRVTQRGGAKSAAAHLRTPPVFRQPSQHRPARLAVDNSAKRHLYGRFCRGALRQRERTPSMIEPHAESATLRQMMVDCQIRTFDVTELRLIARFLDVPREPFVPAAAVDIAYSDHAIALGGGRKLLPPLVLARMIQEAEVDAGARVLDVGCATGYSTAILAGMAASVVAVEKRCGARRTGTRRAGQCANRRRHDC